MRSLIRVFDNSAVKVLVGLIQIYVGLAFFGVIPGFVHPGHALGVISGCIFVCLGIVGTMSAFMDD